MYTLYITHKGGNIHSWKVCPLRHLQRIMCDDFIVWFILIVWQSELADLHLCVTEASMRDPRIPQPVWSGEDVTDWSVGEFQKMIRERG